MATHRNSDQLRDDLWGGSGLRKRAVTASLAQEESKFRIAKGKIGQRGSITDVVKPWKKGNTNPNQRKRKKMKNYI